MQTTAIFRTLPSDTRPSFFRLFGSWLRDFRGHPGTKFSQVSLPKGKLQRIGIAAGTAFACERGTLWITDAQGWEVVLEAGESRVCAQDGDLLVEALAPAVFTVKAGTAAA